MTTVSGSNICGRRVQFNTCVNTVSAAASSEVSSDEKNEIWYQKWEMDEFRRSAREVSRQMGHDVVVPTEIDESHLSTLRGLESRRSHERIRNKLLARRAILAAHTELGDPDKVALFACKCAIWAKQVAFIVGTNDFHSAYHPSHPFLTEVPLNSFPINSCSLKRKLSIGLQKSAQDIPIPILKMISSSILGIISDFT